MENGTTHQMEYSSTNASAVINSALGNLTSGRTWQEKVVLMGNFSIDSTIYIHSYTYLELIGMVRTVANANYDMVCNANTTYTHSTTIKGGIWYYVKNSSTTRDIIHWNCTAQPSGYYNPPEFFDLDLRRAGRDALSITAVGSDMAFYVNGLRVQHANRHALYLKSVTDSYFRFGNIPVDGIGTSASIYLNAVYHTEICDFYCNHGIYAHWCRNLNIHDGFIDTGMTGIDLNYSRYGRFTNLNIHTANANITYGIKIGGFGSYYSHDNIFDDIYIGQMGQTGNFTYGVGEVDAQSLVGCDGRL